MVIAIRTLIGLAVSLAGLLAINYSAFRLGTIGTCASGGPYVSARPCPAGTEWVILLILAGVVCSMFIGPAIFGSGKKRGSGMNLRVMQFSLLFLSLATTFAVSAFAPGATDVGGTDIAAIVLLIVFIPMGLVPLVLLFTNKSKQSDLAKLKASGRQATGTISSIQDTGVSVNDNPRVKMTIQIQPTGGELPFEIEKTTVVSRVAVPRSGDKVTVYYDPNDHDKNSVMLGDHSGLSGMSIKTTPDQTAPPATPPTPASPVASSSYAVPAEDVDDTVQSLVKLAELRDRGILSQAEFDAQKKKLLGG